MTTTTARRVATAAELLAEAGSQTYSDFAVAYGQPHLTVIFETAEARRDWLGAHAHSTWMLTDVGAFLLDYTNEWRDVNGYGATLAHFSPGRKFQPGPTRCTPSYPVTYGWYR